MVVVDVVLVDVEDVVLEVDVVVVVVGQAHRGFVVGPRSVMFPL